MAQTRSQELVIEASPFETYKFNLGKPPEYIGHLLKFSIGDETLKEDFPVTDPENPDQGKKVCGILTLTRWDREVGGVLTIAGRVTADNRAKLARSDAQKNQGTKAKFNIVWYMYDEPENNYFKYFHTNEQEIEALVAENYDLWISPKTMTDLTQVRNSEFSLGMIGSDKKDQDLHYAPSASDKIAQEFSRAKA